MQCNIVLLTSLDLPWLHRHRRLVGDTARSLVHKDQSGSSPSGTTSWPTCSHSTAHYRATLRCRRVPLALYRVLAAVDCKRSGLLMVHLDFRNINFIYCCCPLLWRGKTDRILYLWCVPLDCLVLAALSYPASGGHGRPVFAPPDDEAIKRETERYDTQ